MRFELIPGGLSESAREVLPGIVAPDTAALPAAADEFVVAQASAGHGADGVAPAIDIFSRRRVDSVEDQGSGGGDGGSGEGGGENPNRGQLMNTIRLLADGELGRYLYSSEKPVIADEALKRLGESIWLPGRPGHDGPKIGRLGEGLVRFGGYKIKVEASYLTEDAKQLVDRLAAEDYDVPIAKEHLKISIYDEDIDEADVDEDTDTELQVYVELPTGAPAWFEVILPPEKPKSPLVLSRFFNELGLRELDNLPATGCSFNP